MLKEIKNFLKKQDYIVSFHKRDNKIKVSFPKSKFDFGQITYEYENGQLTIQSNKIKHQRSMIFTCDRYAMEPIAMFEVLLLSSLIGYSHDLIIIKENNKEVEHITYYNDERTPKLGNYLAEIMIQKKMVDSIESYESMSSDVKIIKTRLNHWGSVINANSHNEGFVA